MEEGAGGWESEEGGKVAVHKRTDISTGVSFDKILQLVQLAIEKRGGRHDAALKRTHKQNRK